jgi:hypothetical protein
MSISRYKVRKTKEAKVMIEKPNDKTHHPEVVEMKPGCRKTP